MRAKARVLSLKSASPNGVEIKMSQVSVSEAVEHLEIHHRRQPLQRIPRRAQRRISVRQIKETRLANHLRLRSIRRPLNQISASKARVFRGVQLGAKYVANDNSGKHRFYADYHWEDAAGIQRALIGIGYAYRIGRKNPLEVAFEANQLETRNNHGFRAATGLIAGVTARGAI